MASILATVFQPLKLLGQGFSTMAKSATTTNSLVKPEGFLLSTVRTKVRCYFPRPNEVRRVRRHGWNFRMSTHNGRKTIMRRLLKGRFVLTH